MYDCIIPKPPWNTNWIVIQVAACVACSFANCPRRWSRLCIPAAVLTPREKVEKTHTTLDPNEWILIFFLVATHPNWFSGGYKWCYATSHASYHTTATHEIRKQTQWTKIKFHTSTKTTRVLVYSIKQWWWGDTWQRAAQPANLGRTCNCKHPATIGLGTASINAVTTETNR